MPKGNYKPGRDRRELQGGMPGGKLGGFYQLRVQSRESSPGVIVIECVQVTPGDGNVIMVNVWGAGGNIDDVPIVVTKAGVPVPVTWEIVAEDLFEIRHGVFEGLYLVHVPVAHRAMTAPGNLFCAGLLQEVFFCPRERTEYVTTITRDNGVDPPLIEAVTVEGSLGEGVFTGTSTNWGEVNLRWSEEAGWPTWVIRVIDPNPPDGVLLINSNNPGVRCDPTNGTYSDEISFQWTASVALPP